MQPKLGIIAGGGSLPGRIIDVCQSSGRSYYVIGIIGYASPTLLEGTPHSWVHISKAGAAFETLKDKNVKEIVMIGDVKLPSLFETFPDYRSVKFFAKVAFKSLFKFVGDNSLLIAAAAELEEEGFVVIGIDEIVEDLLAPGGLLGSVEIKEQFFSDIEFGVNASLNLGKRDAGQAVIIKSGEVIIEEGSDGTAQMIKDCLNLSPKGIGGILVKLKKPGQDRRMDLPTIGVNTVLQASEAGLSGIIIQAGETIIIDREKVISTANKKGIFVNAIDLKDFK